MRRDCWKRQTNKPTPNAKRQFSLFIFLSRWGRNSYVPGIQTLSRAFDDFETQPVPWLVAAVCLRVRRTSCFRPSLNRFKVGAPCMAMKCFSASTSYSMVSQARHTDKSVHFEMDWCRLLSNQTVLMVGVGRRASGSRRELEWSRTGGGEVDVHQLPLPPVTALISRCCRRPAGTGAAPAPFKFRACCVAPFLPHPFSPPICPTWLTLLAAAAAPATATAAIPRAPADASPGYLHAPCARRQRRSHQGGRDHRPRGGRR